MLERIREVITDNLKVKEAMLADETLQRLTATVAEVCIAALRQDHKIWFCGNGGSAADAQHLAAELSGRFYLDRAPLFAEALHVNTSYLTAIANDYNYEEVYRRLVEAKGRAGDVLFALSTSGNSPNILLAAEQARRQGVTVVGMSGADGGKLRAHCDYLLCVPSKDTPRIQEGHILLGHIVCELVEAALFDGR